MNASIYTQRQHQGPQKVGVSYNENVVKSHQPFRHSDKYRTHSDEYRPSARKMNKAGIPAIFIQEESKLTYFSRREVAVSYQHFRAKTLQTEASIIFII